THFPHDLTLGEEDETDMGTMQRILADREGIYWTIDGLDGTQNWELGTTFGGMVARRKGNEILYAAVFQPMDEHVYGAGFFEAEKGCGAWRWYDEETHIQILAAQENALKRRFVMIEGSSSKSFKNARVVKLGQRVSTRTNVSSCFSTTIVASGLASGMLVIENPPWDTWPALLFIPEAGGIVTDWDGKPVTPANCGRIIAAGNEIDHDIFLELLTP
ncbi:MAG: inositol monophosphatase family protein, partial [bacterium]|nr:inositol monophosphatase family protein [bacterium]